MKRTSGNVLSRPLQGSICTELISRLSEHGAQLARAVSFAAEVDCLIALATAARDYNLTRPVLTRDNVLDIRQGADAICCHLHGGGHSFRCPACCS